MGTRCSICFNGKYDTKENPGCIIFRHWDGHPETTGTDILAFLEHIKANIQDNRFDDPSILASRYVVWLASQFQESTNPLNFLSIRIMQEHSGDIEYIYIVDCAKGTGLPEVSCYEPGNLNKKLKIPALKAKQLKDAQDPNRVAKNVADQLGMVAEIEGTL